MRQSSLDRRAEIMIPTVLAKIVSWKPTRGQKPVPPNNLKEQDEMENWQGVDNKRVRKGGFYEVFAHQMEEEDSDLMEKGSVVCEQLMI